MGLLTLFTKTPPEIGGYTFDAVLEDELEYSVTIPTYPVESGAEISDHRIINPVKYRITVVISNKPLKQSLGQFAASMAGGLVSNLTDNPLVAAVAGVSAGFLASGNSTRASAALENLIGVLEGANPFDVQAGDVTLKNMVITKISRKKDTSNEGALIAVLELQEYITLDRLNKDGQPSHAKLDAGSKAQAACSSAVSKGSTALKTAGTAAKDYVKGVLV